jgi:hypothetical protein
MEILMRISTRRSFLWLTLSLLLVIPTIVTAQVGAPAPTLAETQDWIKGFLAPHGCVTAAHTDGNGWMLCSEVASSTGCTVVFDLTRQWFHADGTIDQNTITTNHIHVNFTDVPLSSARVRDLPGWSGQQLTIDKMILFLTVDSKENGDRLVKALNMEIQLCGGKASPF